MKEINSEARKMAMAQGQFPRGSPAMIEISRRKALLGALGLIAAPAIVKASSLMRIVAYCQSDDIASTLGSITIYWPQVSNAAYYNIYLPVRINA